MLYNICASINNFSITDTNHLNSLIQHQANCKNDKAILHTFSKMEDSHILPNSKTLPLILKACSKLHDVESGKRIHHLIKNTDLIDDVRVKSSLVDFYGKCGFLDDARQVFDEMCERDVVLWNVMINCYVGCRCYEEGLCLFRGIWSENLKPTSVTMVALLVACGELFELRLGKEVHGYCLRSGLFDSSFHLGTALIGFYAKFDVGASRVVFDSMGLKNVVSWNAMINAYFGAGYQFEALSLLVEMLLKEAECDKVTLLTAIKACSEIEYLGFGKQLHQLTIKFGYAHDPYITNTLLSFYSKTQSSVSSTKLFESAPVHDTAMWNSMLSACLDCGSHAEACRLFSRMLSEGFQVTEATLTVLLSLCSEIGSESKVVKSLHAKIIKRRFYDNSVILDALMRNYSEIGCIQEALLIFDKLHTPDIISWNIIISALVDNRLMNRAWNYFKKMLHSEIKPNAHTVLAALSICKDASFLNVGRSLHAYVLKHGIRLDVELNTALVEMYMNCGDEATARNLFEKCSNKDIVSWNCLIANYVRNNLAHKALVLFSQMILEVEPNSVTVINILSSCTDIASLPLGQCLHAYTIRKNYFGGFNLSLANALLSMYARCGSMKNAETIFETMQRRNISSWNALIAGYGLNGQVNEALQSFSVMLKEGFKPNGRSFLSILAACSHSGTVEKGLDLFKSMIYDFRITPMLVHYGCIVDLLGRAGYVDEAKTIIRSMPFEPDASVWRALLSTCRDNTDPSLGITVFQRLVEIEPENPGNYIMLSNIYATAGLWSKVENLRTRLKEKGLSKNPGMSWIFVRNQVHCFIAGDQSLLEDGEVHTTLKSLLSVLKDDGYIPNLPCVVDDELEISVQLL
ncbi:hypothetical protein RND81_09G258900 [Saponaria officinalis]|uniref:Chlororespiratory reduction 21 n=1 Tax=Saponaria officinalis TaxID=3572 RepID=A0AAW1ISM2_SAPOF